MLICPPNSYTSGMERLGDALKVKKLRTWLVALVAPPETKEWYKIEDFFMMFIPLSVVICCYVNAPTALHLVH